MKANPSPTPVADYCQDINLGKIVVNNDYQRAEGIWSHSARSFFIESILLEYPIPKLYLHARLDLLTRQVIKEIVDGQQRSSALRDFYNDKLRLSRTLITEDVRGLKYSQLDDQWKTAFLSYSLPIDQFTGVGEDDVQEAFRRMNANNVPLNEEEQRNAQFQGPFKWFILDIAKSYTPIFRELKLFSRRDFVRMVDVKAYSEIAYVLDSDFATIKSERLNALYKKYNSSFPQIDEFRIVICTGLDEFVRREELHLPVFLRAHIFQSIVIALISLMGKFRFVERIYGENKQHVDEMIDLNPTIETLGLCLEDPDSYPGYHRFIQACTRGTNTGEARTVRFLYFTQALSNAVE
ncbi:MULTISPECIES: DUF262 domain-containing protein [unclassified Aureimonas]|uniref:DUF262 domain-containing protein n=1 Tax=unclassified Aureimonas TaxID=2615206 RepID=UPI0006FE0475|nr:MULTISPECIES: DUF262 domain-containing protein [unclassified Aureimonas]KQT52994.1 hypothetical protein ASG62_13900 [Aureimonas sp. Leaf427]KQT80451.1 hypothetical protein ASG54_07750 [Aureimonas sp. Leaf460]